VTITYQAYLGRFYASAWGLTINATAKVVTAGFYYPKGYSGESAVQFLEHLTDKLNDVVGGATATLDLTTGLVTLDFNGNTTSVTWTSTALRDLLGFTGDLSSATSYVATNKMRYCWFPTRGLADYPGDLTRFWGRGSTSRTVVSADDTAYGIKGSLTYSAMLRYAMLPAADVVTTSTTVWRALEAFFEDVMHAAQSMRICPDRTSYTSTTYVTALLNKGKDAYGDFAGFAKRHARTNNGLWDVDIPLKRYVP